MDINGFLSYIKKSIQNAQTSAKGQQQAINAGIYSPRGNQPMLTRSLITDLDPTIQNIKKNAPVLSWMQGNPIKPEGIQINTGNILDGILTNLTGGKYSPEEQAYYQKIQQNQPLTPQDVQIGKNLAKQEGLNMIGMMAGPKAVGGQEEIAKRGFSSLADKKPRFEIDDSGAVMKPFSDIQNVSKDSLTLDKVLNHKELYDRYPELKNTKVNLYGDSYQSLTDRMQKGSYNNGQIDVNVGEKTPDDVKSTLLHEIQHAIQEKEGFARGGSPETFQIGNQIASEVKNQEKQLFKETGYDDWLFNLLSKDKAKHSELMKKAENSGYSMEPFWKEYAKTLAPDDAEYFLVRAKQLEKEMSNLKYSSDPVNSYKRLAGEIESRDTQARMNLTPEQRATTLPYQSQNIPLKEQIVRFDGGTAQSVDPKQAVRSGKKLNKEEQLLKKIIEALE